MLALALSTIYFRQVQLITWGAQIMLAFYLSLRACPELYRKRYFAYFAARNCVARVTRCSLTLVTFEIYLRIFILFCFSSVGQGISKTFFYLWIWSELFSSSYFGFFTFWHFTWPNFVLITHSTRELNSFLKYFLTQFLIYIRLQQCQ